MAYSFNGSSDYLDLGSAPVSAEALTLHAWVNPTALAGAQCVASIGNSAGSAQWQIRFNGDKGEAVSGTSGGTAAAATMAAPVVNGAWTTITGVFASPTSRSILVGNNIANKVTNTTSISVSGVNGLTIGTRYVSATRGAFFNGGIAEIAAWNTALTDDEIVAVNSGLSPLLVKPQNLVCFFPMIANTNDMLTQSALGVHGTTILAHTRTRGVSGRGRSCG